MNFILEKAPEPFFSLLSASLGLLNTHSQQPVAEIWLCRSLTHPASNSSHLLLIQSLRITTPHYLYKQRLKKNKINKTGQGVGAGAAAVSHTEGVTRDVLSTALSIDGSKKLLLS